MRVRHHLLIYNAKQAPLSAGRAFHGLADAGPLRRGVLATHWYWFMPARHAGEAARLPPRLLARLRRGSGLPRGRAACTSGTSARTLRRDRRRWPGRRTPQGGAAVGLPPPVLWSRAVSKLGSDPISGVCTPMWRNLTYWA